MNSRNSEGTYEGNWANDLKNGDGTFFYRGTPRGKKYYGQWLNDMKHGVGVIIYPDGNQPIHLFSFQTHGTCC